jgi:hypothetical protein
MGKRGFSTVTTAAGMPFLHAWWNHFACPYQQARKMITWSKNSTRAAHCWKCCPVEMIEQQ